MLIIVLLISLGLVTLTLYFANSMSAELHAADNRVSESAARQALAGGIRYAGYVLTNYAVGGVVPRLDANQNSTPDYRADALPVGDASFWFIGRDNDNPQAAADTEPHFALVDESSKLNLNTATSAMLQQLPLPGMTQDLADAIVAWRTNNANSATYENSYSQSDPPRHNKGAPFESVDEVRLVFGATLDILLGEDANRNGALDANENDGETSAPRDDQDGQLIAGLLDYVTVYSQLPATAAGGGRRINLNTLNTTQGRNQLTARLRQRGILPQRITQIAAIINQRYPIAGGPGAGAGGGRGATGGRGGGGQPAANNPFNSVADFMVSTAMTADEWALIHTDLTVTTVTAGTQNGLVNVNTASQAVLACLPGIGPDNAANLITYRQANPDALTSFAWLTQVLTPAQIRQAGPYITDQSYQFSADVAAVAANGRGYCRERVVFDTSAGTPRIVYRQDLTACGWALGADVRRNLRGPKNST